jgi:hypothetical protein
MPHLTEHRCLTAAKNIDHSADRSVGCQARLTYLDFSFFNDCQLTKVLHIEVSCQDLATIAKISTMSLRLGDKVKLYSTARWGRGSGWE